MDDTTTLLACQGLTINFFRSLLAPASTGSQAAERNYTPFVGFVKGWRQIAVRQLGLADSAAAATHKSARSAKTATDAPVRAGDGSSVGFPQVGALLCWMGFQGDSGELHASFRVILRAGLTGGPIFYISRDVCQG